MTFLAKQPALPEQDSPIKNGDFWPEIDPAQIRIEHRMDGTITSARLRSALIEAMATVNSELSVWRLQQIMAGKTTLVEVAADTIDDTSTHVHRYLRAVGCLAKASMIERYRDFDATASGNKKADQLENPIDDLHRDARWAISDILGIGRSTVELI